MTARQITALLMKAIPAHKRVLITGQPGIGKTHIVNQVAGALGADVMVDYLSTADPTDAKGMPFLNKEGTEAHFMPFGNLKRLIDAQKLTIALWDDIGQAVQGVQAAYMNLLDSRRVNGYKISNHVVFCGATNRTTDKAAVHSIIEPLKGRYHTIVNLDFSLEDWTAWALSHGVPTEFIAFARFRPEILASWKPTAGMENGCTPRNFVSCSEMYSLGLDAETEYETYKGSIGEGAATELIGFLRIFRSLPNPDSVLLNPTTAIVPDITKPDGPATLYALTGALARKASVQTADRLLQYAGRLPAEFSVLLTRDSVKLCPDICSTRAFITWASDHSDVLL